MSLLFLKDFISEWCDSSKCVFCKIDNQNVLELFFDVNPPKLKEWLAKPSTRLVGIMGGSQDGYPNMQVIKDDIQKKYGYVLSLKEEIVGYCALLISDEPRISMNIQRHTNDSPWNISFMRLFTCKKGSMRSSITHGDS